MLLIALPFVDLRSERRILRRPVAIVAAILVVLSMGVLTYKGAVAKESLASEVVAGRAGVGAATGLPEQQAGGRRREALRAVGLHVVPHVPRHGLLEPRCARPERDRRDAARTRSSSRRTSATRRKFNNAVMPVFGNLGSPAEHPQHRHLPRRVEGRQIA